MTTVRDAAARTLLAWRDDAVLEHALRALESFSLARRRIGFDMVSRFGEHALGYAPDAPEEERVAAVARWRDGRRVGSPDWTPSALQRSPA